VWLSDFNKAQPKTYPQGGWVWAARAQVTTQIARIEIFGMKWAVFGMRGVND
jgi:hypothetical protein